MTRFRFLVLLLIVFVPFLTGRSIAQAQTPVPKADTQSWNDIQFPVPLSKKVDFLIQGTLRVGSNLTTLVDERWGFGFNYKAWEYLNS